MTGIKSDQENWFDHCWGFKVNNTSGKLIATNWSRPILFPVQSNDFYDADSKGSSVLKIVEFLLKFSPPSPHNCNIYMKVGLPIVFSLYYYIFLTRAREPAKLKS